MADISTTFFDRLRATGRVPALARVTGSLRVDVVDGKKVSKTQIWVRRGAVTVGTPSGTPDCLLVAPRAVWEALVTGEQQTLPVFLRGAVSASGDPAMLVLMRRLFIAAAVPEDLAGTQRAAAPAGRRRTTTATAATPAARKKVTGPPRKTTGATKATATTRTTTTRRSRPEKATATTRRGRS